MFGALKSISAAEKFRGFKIIECKSGHRWPFQCVLLISDYITDLRVCAGFLAEYKMATQYSDSLILIISSYESALDSRPFKFVYPSLFYELNSARWQHVAKQPIHKLHIVLSILSILSPIKRGNTYRFIYLWRFNGCTLKNNKSGFCVCGGYRNTNPMGQMHKTGASFISLGGFWFVWIWGWLKQLSAYSL